MKECNPYSRMFIISRGSGFLLPHRAPFMRTYTTGGCFVRLECRRYPLNVLTGYPSRLNTSRFYEPFVWLLLGRCIEPDTEFKL